MSSSPMPDSQPLDVLAAKLKRTELQHSASSMMIQGQPALTLHAGDPFLMPPRTPHNALDVGPGTGQMLSTYIVETGQPLATFVDGPPAPATAGQPGGD